MFPKLTSFFTAALQRRNCDVLNKLLSEPRKRRHSHVALRSTTFASSVQFVGTSLRGRPISLTTRKTTGRRRRDAPTN